MITGLRGKIFLSYRWGNEHFNLLVKDLASELVQRGYEVVLDRWYSKFFREESSPIKTLTQEFLSCTFFVAVISRGYTYTLSGTINDPDPDLNGGHDTRNDGFVRDELNLAISNRDRHFGPFDGIGIRVGNFPFPDHLFPFPTQTISEDRATWAPILDMCFGERLPLPAMTRPELKHKGAWYSLPIAPLALAYPLLRRALAEAEGDPMWALVPVSQYPYRSRLDRSHVVYERRAGVRSCQQADVFEVVGCENCTAEFEPRQLKISQTCPRCARGRLRVCVAHTPEAVALIAPHDSVGKDRKRWRRRYAE